MIACPQCGFDNIEGVDACESCQQSLSSLSLPKPTSQIERSILSDRIDALVPREPLVVEPGAPVSMVTRGNPIASRTSLLTIR